MRDFDVQIRKKDFVRIIREPGHRLKEIKDLAFQRVKSEKIEKQAARSEREDKIVPGRFFKPSKPTKIGPDRLQTVENFAELVEKKGFPVLWDGKVNGTHVIPFKTEKGEVGVFSEDGSLLTDQLPKIKKLLEGIDADSFVLDGEIEFWSRGNIGPREQTIGVIHDEKKDDQNLVLNIFGLLFLNGQDLHNKPFKVRRNQLEELLIGKEFVQVKNSDPDLSKLNVLPIHRAESKKELIKDVRRYLAKYPCKEGVVAKNPEGIYPLIGRTFDDFIKFHRVAILEGKVTGVFPTKTEGVFNYSYGVEFDLQGWEPDESRELAGKTYIIPGKTFSTDLKLQEGDPIWIEFEQATLEIWPDEKKVGFGVWAPKIVNSVIRMERGEVEDRGLTLEDVNLPNLVRRWISEESLSISDQKLRELISYSTSRIKNRFGEKSYSPKRWLSILGRELSEIGERISEGPFSSPRQFQHSSAEWEEVRREVVRRWRPIWEDMAKDYKVWDFPKWLEIPILDDLEDLGQERMFDLHLKAEGYSSPTLRYNRRYKRMERERRIEKNIANIMGWEEPTEKDFMREVVKREIESRLFGIWDHPFRPHGEPAGLMFPPFPTPHGWRAMMLIEDLREKQKEVLSKWNQEGLWEYKWFDKKKFKEAVKSWLGEERIRNKIESKAKKRLVNKGLDPKGLARDFSKLYRKAIKEKIEPMINRISQQYRGIQLPEAQWLDSFHFHFLDMEKTIVDWVVDNAPGMKGFPPW